MLALTSTPKILVSTDTDIGRNFGGTAVQRYAHGGASASSMLPVGGPP
jgi:hypothetical protein